MSAQITQTVRRIPLARQHYANCVGLALYGREKNRTASSQCKFMVVRLVVLLVHELCYAAFCSALSRFATLRSTHLLNNAASRASERPNGVRRYSTRGGTSG